MGTEIQEKIHLLPGQARLLTDFTSRTLAAIAGTGAGKTMTGYWWLDTRLQAFPGFAWGVAEPTYKMLDRVIINSSDPDRPSLEDYLRMRGYNPDFHKQEGIIKTSLGQIYLYTAENPNTMQGAPLKGFWLDEAGQMSLLAHETALQRCSMMSGQELITTTPYNLGWLLTEIVNQKGDGIHVEQWRSIDRPGFPRDSYEYMRSHLPSWRFAMMYDAQFERPAGLIYSSFNEAFCIVPRFEIPLNWPVYVGQDFGADNPAALFFAQNPATNELFLFAEYMPGGSISVYDRVQAMAKIATRQDGKQYNVIQRIGGNPQEDEIRQAYGAHGWTMAGPHPMFEHVEPQITHVIGLHRLNKIKVFRDMTHYLDEKRTFSRKLDEAGQVTEKIDSESRFHLMACERYLMSWMRLDTENRGQKPVTKRAAFTFGG